MQPSPPYSRNTQLHVWSDCARSVADMQMTITAIKGSSWKFGMSHKLLFYTETDQKTPEKYGIWKELPGFTLIKAPFCPTLPLHHIPHYQKQSTARRVPRDPLATSALRQDGMPSNCKSGQTEVFISSALGHITVTHGYPGFFLFSIHIWVV